ncbi:MAG TPA: isoprenylcysteine carboxylmethyltransferase family protein [bacterium]
MQKPPALAGSALFLVIAPGILAGVIPWQVTGWEAQPPLLGWPWTRGLGILLIGAGLPILLDSFRRFAVEGLGTPAPVAPPQHLVVRGAYRHVRNPMYVAVVSLVLGQSIAFASVPLSVYGAGLAVAFHLFVLLYEEPVLRATFGAEYAAYCANVSRWWPRLRPWRG